MGIRRYEADGRSWYRVTAWVYEGGRRRLKRQGRIPTKEQAERLAKTWASDSIDGRWFDRPGEQRHSVAELWATYAASSRGLDSHASDRSRAQHLERHLGERPAAGLTQADVDAYRAARAGEHTRRGGPPSPATLDREIELLKRLLGYAQRCGLLRVNPLAGVALLRAPNVRSSVLGEEEFQAGIARLPERSAWMRPVLLVAFDTGMRIGEVLGLRRDRLDWRTGRVELQASETKTEEPRIIYLSERALEALRALPAHVRSPLVFWAGKSGKRRSLPRRGFQAAFGPGVWVHDLRRSFITNARREGELESEIMKMTGHRTRAVFARYNIVTDEDVRGLQQRRDERRRKAGERLDRGALSGRRPPEKP
jgi:integrase